MKKILPLIFTAIFFLSSCSTLNIYKTEKIKRDAMYMTVDIDYPVFKNAELEPLNEDIKNEMNREFKTFSHDMKYLWLDWEAANQKLYPGTETKPFEMKVSVSNVTSDKDKITVVLSGYKNDGWSKNRMWSKTFVYDKVSGQTTSRVDEEDHSI